MDEVRTNETIQEDESGRALLPLPEECIAARRRMDWSQKDLAEKSDLAEHEIAAFEEEPAALHNKDILSIQRAFALAGIEFRDGRLCLLENRVPTLSQDGLIEMLHESYMRYGELHAERQRALMSIQ